MFTSPSHSPRGKTGIGFLPLLLTLTTLALLAVPSRAGQPAVTLSPVSPRQGDALFIRVQGAAPTSVQWLNRSFPFFHEGDDYVTAVPIRPETPVGGHTLSLKLPSGEALRQTVQVARVDYPVQRLAMAPKTARLYNYKGVEKEERPIGAAIRTRSPDRLWHGDWEIGTQGRISTHFGERRSRNGKDVGRHRGLDIAAPEGAPVVAGQDGKVVLIGKFLKHGGTVVIDHGQGVTSLYLHMSAIHVKNGQTVSRGERVGSVGATGVATGPHLHWAIYAQGTPVEPLEFCRLSKRGIKP
jgi:murein DD-endopeptidase MepM/ murein hydrolase activator NlpD